jgi:hypothetical protein
MRRGFRDVRELKRVERNLPVFPDEIFPDEIVDKDGADDLPDEIGLGDLNGFKKIKPEEGMTLEECDKFWNQLFTNPIEPDQGVNLNHDFKLPDQI